MQINGFSGSLAEEARQLLEKNKGMVQGRSSYDPHLYKSRVDRLERIECVSEGLGPPKGHVARIFSTQGTLHNCEGALRFKNQSNGTCHVYYIQGDGNGKTCRECVGLVESVMRELHYLHGGD
jgi:hypothetical protein